jgi:hypothetical protein
MSDNFSSFINKVLFEILYYFGVIERHVKNFINIFQQKANCIEPVINIKIIIFDQENIGSEINISCETIDDFKEKDLLIKDLLSKEDKLVLIENEKEETIIFNGNFSKLEEIMTNYFNNVPIFNKTDYKFLSFAINFKNESYEVDMKPYFFVNNDIGNIYFIVWLLNSQFNNEYSFFKDNYTLTFIDHEANIRENVILKSILLQKTEYKTID